MKALKTVTNLVCWVAMISGFLAAVDGVQLAHTPLQLVCSIALPGTLFACGYFGRKVINQTIDEL